MGMRINSSSSQATGSDYAAVRGQRQQSFKDMLTAIQSGDVSKAQTAYAALSNGKAGGDANGPLAQIGKALQSGDIGAAQQALQSLQSQSGAHGHHHHGGGGGVQAPAPAPAPAPVGQGTLLNITA